VIERAETMHDAPGLREWKSVYVIAGFAKGLGASHVVPATHCLIRR
jgi:hypothetical protein